MTTTKPKRFTVRDLRVTQYSGIGRTKTEPWVVIDTTTNRTVDEFSSKRAADITARHLNAEAKAAPLGVVYRVFMPAMPIEKADEMALEIGNALARLAYSRDLHVEVTR